MAPGGLFFRQALGTRNTYRLTIAGHGRVGHTTVRLVFAGATPQWFPAPEGSTTLTVAGSPSIEVVVYSDTPYAYHLDNLQADACSDCQTPAAVMAGAFSGWATEPFGPVEWTQAQPGIRLGSRAAPGGVIFRRSVDPDKAYRLTIDGQPIAGHTTARLTMGKAGPEWFPAPTGQQFVNLSATRTLELVVYSDTPYSYNLRSLTLDECPRCLGDAQLRDLILADVPSLKDDLRTAPLVAARELLNWVSNTVDISDSSIAAAMTAKVSAMHAGQALQDVWLADAGGTGCAGFTAFFSKVLAVFGYRAFTIDVGYAASPVTHVTTVLMAGHGADPAFYIFDPTFNGAYVDRRSGAFASVDEVLGSPAAEDSRYQFQTRPIKRDYIYDKTDAAELSAMLSPLGLSPAACEVTDAGQNQRYLCKHVPYDARVVRAAWKEPLRALRIPADADLILTLMRHRVLSVSATDPRSRQRFLELLARHAVPYGNP